MLFTGWEVRIVKNCDRGLENAARGRSKHYYKILSKNSTVPTSIKTWKVNFADAFTEWQTKFSSSPENQVLCPLQSDPTMNQTEPTNFLATIRVHRIPD